MQFSLITEQSCYSSQHINIVLCFNKIGNFVDYLSTQSRLSYDTYKPNLCYQRLTQENPELNLTRQLIACNGIWPGNKIPQLLKTAWGNLTVHMNVCIVVHQHDTQNSREHSSEWLSFILSLSLLTVCLVWQWIR